ncbi:hypothetical protein ASD65_18145 [Microbacterium sp. Root61]|uniref:hypothetical protein n=1 Tax=Microbacterium sp. Root61 TaxID=1736570 RepID=UPI0006F857D9|nr:hypothetical protein [Microbacterium sp. Root61]KRA22395.1 hypothetical protein ASD65_18145 [Microbacterium sp. Root61]
MSSITRVAPRAIVAALAMGALAFALTGCVPEPAPTASGSPTATSITTPAPSPTPTETSDAGSDITLPANCEAIYSPEMLATMQSQVPPLNDPGVTMFSSQIVEALEVLNSGAPTLRCSWGQPSEVGMSTNVTIVDGAQADSVRTALLNAGYSCEDTLDGTMCRFEEELMTQDDTLVHRGETHFFRGNGWVATAWLNVAPEGYTEDIVATLWG